MIKLRDLLNFSPIDILIKSADHRSYHAILQELKDKEIYNMIIDIHNTENMSDFLKAVRLIDLWSLRQAKNSAKNKTIFWNVFVFVP